MKQTTMQVQERQNGYVGRNLTRHSTGARVSRSLIVESDVAVLSSRPLNSVVRFLLNDEAQSSA
jgi:hypothetical protein